MSGDIQQEGNQAFHYGYKIKVFGLKEGDKKLQWDKDLLNHQKSVTVENIITSATTYTVSIARWSRTTAPSIIQGDLMGHGPLDALSNFEEKTVITPPPPPLTEVKKKFEDCILTYCVLKASQRAEMLG